jgi:ribosomal 30S subunit maturation factor RimM
MLKKEYIDCNDLKTPLPTKLFEAPSNFQKEDGSLNILHTFRVTKKKYQVDFKVAETSMIRVYLHGFGTVESKMSILDPDYKEKLAQDEFYKKNIISQFVSKKSKGTYSLFIEFKNSDIKKVDCRKAEILIIVIPYVQLQSSLSCEDNIMTKAEAVSAKEKTI